MIRRVFFSVVIFAILTLAEAEAACSSARPMASERLDAFVQNPQALLFRHPQGTVDMAFEVVGLASASKVTLTAMKFIFRQANEAQHEALGVGLAQAFRLCRYKDPRLAHEIYLLVTESGDIGVEQVFKRHIPDDSITASGSDSGNWGLFSGGKSAVGSAAASGQHSYLAGTSVGMRLDDRKFHLSDPFAPVKIRTR